MKRMYAYYEAHPTSGFVVECETDGRWTCSFRHEGDFNSLYNECERRAKVNEARLEAVIQGLPKEPAQRQRPAAIPVVHTMMQACFSFAKPEATPQCCFAFA